jgi:hypothetical protein
MRFLRTHRLLALAVLPVLLFLSSPVSAASASGWNNRPNHVTFNALPDNPIYGDERDFLRARSISNNNFGNTLKVNGSAELVFELYFDNNAAKASQMAKDTTAKISLPDSSGKDLTVKAFIEANNSQPVIVTDEVKVVSDSPIKLTYESGSAKIWNNVWRGKTLDNSLMSNGTKLGFNQLNGVVPGGPHYSGFVTVKVKVSTVQPQPQPVSGVSNHNPNTGPGDVIGVFAASSALGTAFHMAKTARRNRR